MTHRKFYRYDEAADLVGDRETVRQAMLAWKLPAFIELHYVQCVVHAMNGDFPADGKNALCKWWHEFFLDDEKKAKRRIYTLNGWFRLGEITVESFARASGTTGRWPVLADADGTAVEFEIDLDSRDSALWFRADDIERLAAPPSAPASPPSDTRDDKPLDPRERVTFLCIIGALAAYAKLV